MAEIRVEEYLVGTFPEANAASIKAAIAHYRDRLLNSPDCQPLVEADKTLKELLTLADEELETILLRRILPGKYKYCS